MKPLLLVSLLLLAVTSLWAQAPLTITIGAGGSAETVTLTASQVATLTAELARVNARSRVDDTPFTLEQWLKDEVERAIGSLVQRGQAADRDTACEAFNNLPPSAQVGIMQQLGGVSPCASP